MGVGLSGVKISGFLGCRPWGLACLGFRVLGFRV